MFDWVLNDASDLLIKYLLVPELPIIFRDFLILQLQNFLQISNECLLCNFPFNNSFNNTS